MEPVVTVRELRQNLSVYLERVLAGETLRVTRRGEPVAVLAPLSEREAPIDRLVAEGRAVHARLDVLDLPAPLQPREGMSIGEALEQQRNERLP